MNDRKSKITIPGDKLWEYEECFRWFDKTGQGYILAHQLPVAVRAVGQYWTFADLKKLSQEFKLDEHITLQMFLNICSRKYGVKPDVASLEKAFEVFDRTKTGLIYLEDLRHVLSSIGEKITHEEFGELCLISGIQYKGGIQTIDKKQFMTLFGAQAI